MHISSAQYPHVVSGSIVNSADLTDRVGMPLSDSLPSGSMAPYSANLQLLPNRYSRATAPEH